MPRLSARWSAAASNWRIAISHGSWGGIDAACFAPPGGVPLTGGRRTGRWGEGAEEEYDRFFLAHRLGRRGGEGGGWLGGKGTAPHAPPRGASAPGSPRP